MKYRVMCVTIDNNYNDKIIFKLALTLPSLSKTKNTLKIRSPNTLCIASFKYLQHTHDDPKLTISLRMSAALNGVFCRFLAAEAFRRALLVKLSLLQ